MVEIETMLLYSIVGYVLVFDYEFRLHGSSVQRSTPPNAIHTHHRVKCYRRVR